jgi:hypothetical protein
MHRLLCRVLLTLAVGLVVASPAGAVTSVFRVNGERTELTASPGAREFVTTFGITVTPTGGAKLGANDSLIFTITGGFVTSEQTGEIHHSGGVLFTRGQRHLQFRDFRLVRNSKGTFVSALVGTHRVVYAWVTHFAVSDVSDTEAVVTGELVLSREAAEQFNRLIESDAATPGVEIGKLHSIIRIATS